MTTYQLNEEKMFADITDDMAIIINSETGIYYGMNSLATVVFENIIKGVSQENICAKLKELGAGDDVKQNLQNLIDAMKEKEILLPAEETDAQAEIDAKIAKDANFVMTLSEYNDAQELLLADPIHEVKEDTGWTPEKDSIGYSKEETKIREQQVK